MSDPTRVLPHEKDLLLATMDLPTEQRADYLNQVCGSDVDLMARVKTLLKNAETSDSFMARPAIDLNRTTAMTSIVVGGRIGRYRLMEQLGEGGMGVVYVAEQLEPVRRKVALKVIKPGMDSRQVIGRFEAERQALALMDHPNIARVLDAGTTEQGLPYFVMELVRGLPITEHCDRADLSIRQRLELFGQVCRAVQHAHQKGVIHRDLKPSNVLVAMHDTVPVVKVIDFGVAKAIGQQLTDGTLYTGFSQLVGTPLYMSPEQAGLSGLDIDTRSDIYSLGVLLYESLVGTTPFDSRTLRRAGIDEMRRIIREVEPPRPSARASTLEAAQLSTISERRQLPPQQLSRQLRGELDWIVMRALEKDRTRRYETVNALAADVERYLNGTAVQAGPPTWTYRYSKLLKRNRSLVTTGMLVLGLIFMGTTLSIRQAVRATQAEIVAERGQESERKARLSEQAARQEAERAKNLAQQSAADTYRHLRGIAHARQGLSEEALVDLADAFDLDPSDESILTTRVALYAHLGRWHEALADALRSAELNENPSFQYQQAVIQVMLGDTQAYREICRRAWVGKPADPDFLLDSQVWACALLPQPIAEIPPLQTLVQKLSAPAIDEGRDSQDAGFPSGEILYRASQPELAVRLMTNESRRWEQTGSIELPSSSSDFLPGYTWYFLAMACHDLGHYSESRSGFFSAAAQAMRHILVDAARRKLALKRGGDVEREHIEIDRILVHRPNEVLDVDQALEALA